MHVHPLKLMACALVVLVLAACGGEATDPSGPGTPEAGQPEAVAATPQAAIKGMLALAEAGKWTEYVETYYGEKHKMDKPDTQLPELAAAMETVGEQLLEALRTCAKEEPTLSEDDTRATYSNGFTLHKREGKWGFHL